MRKNYLPLTLLLLNGIICWGQPFRPLTKTKGIIHQKVIGITGSYRTAVAILEDSSLVSWTLGNGINANSIPFSKDVSVGSVHYAVVDKNGTAKTYGENTYNQVNFEFYPDVAQVVCGYFTTHFLRKDGTMFQIGTHYQSGGPVIPPPANPPFLTKITDGENHALAITKDSLVMAWGKNGRGEVSVPVGVQQVVQVAAGREYSLALKKDGTVAYWGAIAPLDKEGNEVDLTNVKAIAGGVMHALALKKDGTVIAFGYNMDSTLNVPKGLDHVIAIAAGINFSLALKEDGTLVGWGQMTTSHIPIVDPQVVDTLVLSDDFDLVLRKDSSVLVLESSDYIMQNGRQGISTIAAGYRFALLYSDEHNVSGSGGAGTQELTKLRALPGVKNLAAGSHHSVALLQNDSLITWSNYPFYFDVPEDLKKVWQVGASGVVTVALQKDSTLRVWGMIDSPAYLNFPQGITKVTSIAVGGGHVLALKADGSVIAWGNNDEGQATVPSGLRNVKKIAAGYSHSVALKNDGTLVIWGKNIDNQIEKAALLVEVKNIFAGANKTYAFGGEVADPLGLEPFTEPAHLSSSVYPNPNAGHFFVRLEGATSGDKCVFYDLLGNKHEEIALTGSHATYHLSNYQNGLYYYEILRNGEKISTGKIMFFAE